MPRFLDGTLKVPRATDTPAKERRRLSRDWRFRLTCSRSLQLLQGEDVERRVSLIFTYFSHRVCTCAVLRAIIKL